MAKVIGMSQEHRDVLRENLINIQNNLSSEQVEQLCDRLFANKVLDDYSIIALRNQRSHFRKVDELLTQIKTCGSQAFGKFCDALADINPELSAHLRSQGNRSTTEPTSEKQPEIDVDVQSVTVGEEIDSIYPPLDIKKVPITAKYTLKTDNLIYEMSKKPHGYMVIFNQEKFSQQTGMNARDGSTVDADKLESLFKRLNYIVDRCENFTVQKIVAKLSDYSKKDHRNYDSFACAFLSHGEHDFIYGKDGKVNLEEMFAKFRGDKCRSLAGKPKIFFIQACRGQNFDSGADVLDSTLSKETEEEDVTDFVGSTLPSEGDFLLAYATAPGYFAWRNSAGSWFIQAVVEVFEQYHQHMDLLRMLTRVCCFVAQKESQSNNLMYRGKKQIPSIVSRLRRDLFFSIEAARNSGAYSN